MKERLRQERKVQNKKGTALLVGIWSIALILTIILATLLTMQNKKNTKTAKNLTPEDLRAMTYNQVQSGEESVAGTNNVKFDAFFLKDLNGDGEAESIRGTCKEVGKQDTLYMELNVITEGELRNAKIEIQGNNFYFQTALPKDKQLKENYIGNNIRQIEFNTIQNGTQKMLMGYVKSGDYTYDSAKTVAIGNNTNNYSREDNKIILTGIYVNGEEVVEIRKEVPLTVDWYGKTVAVIGAQNQTYSSSSNDLTSRINEENRTLTLDFSIQTQETVNQLLLSKNYVEGTIPELNGFAPIEVISNNENFTYDASTRKFTFTKTAETNSEGIITKSVFRNNTYMVQVVYPIEAYESMGIDRVEINIPVETYYEGYNNPNPEFSNPYKSNIARGTIRAVYTKYVPVSHNPNINITVGKYIYNPNGRYIVSKLNPLKIYNGIVENVKEDEYLVRWNVYTGTSGASEGLVLREGKQESIQKVDQFIKEDSSKDSMEHATENVGIYFSGADGLLEENGYIKIYDDETDELIAEFTKTNWDNGNQAYRYSVPVKHVRVETSATKPNSSFTVYNIKNLNDEYITENYTREEFDTLKFIESTLEVRLGTRNLGEISARAYYEAPFAVAKIGLSKNLISTQATEREEKITIEAREDIYSNQMGWIDGSFLVKIPEEIIEINIKNVAINNSQVEITNYGLVEKEGFKFIKIDTKNKQEKEQGYNITITADITADPRIATTSKPFTLYAANKAGVDYWEANRAYDIYDVNDNLNKEEIINKSEVMLNMIAPNTLLTNQTISEYDDKGSVAVSPQIADVGPVYGYIDNEEKTAKIGVYIKNNYANTITDVVILGKIPFEGNTFVISEGTLGSNFTASMQENGIIVPDELIEKAVVYYSEKEDPTKEINNAENGWKTAEEITDWTKIRTYIIDLGDTVIAQDKEYAFYYKVSLPNGLEFNQVSFSHHGVFFSLNTEEGKYRTKTEPNKVGIRIAEKYNIELTKYQTGKENKVSGATYTITAININPINLSIEYGETKTATTNINGKLTIQGLYAEQIYELKEIKSPEDYELNENKVRFIGHVNKQTGILTIEKISGNIRGEIEVVEPICCDEDGEDNEINNPNGLECPDEYNILVGVEDEAKARLKITKYVLGENGTPLKGARYKITGENYTKIATTNSNGEINLKGLSVGKEYAVEEVKAPEGYYLNENNIEFKIENNNGTYKLKIKNEQGEYENAGSNITGEYIKSATITEEENLPIVSFELTDEKIPTYNLELLKIKKNVGVSISQPQPDDEFGENPGDAIETVEYLAGAKFRLYKEGTLLREFTTNEEGKLVIENLYQYIEGKNIDGIYTIKEVIAPDGYAKVKDIVFKVDGTNGLEFIETLVEGQTAKQYEIEGNTIKLTVEDSPIFKLTKIDGETNEPLSNVKFSIYNVDEGEVPARDSKGEIVGTLEIINGKEYYVVETNGNGEISLNLPEGLYKAVEVEAPVQYDLSKDTYYFGIGASREPITEIVEEARLYRNVCSVYSFN